jgi:hypothetical protein
MAIRSDDETASGVTATMRSLHALDAAIGMSFAASPIVLVMSRVTAAVRDPDSSNYFIAIRCKVSRRGKIGKTASACFSTASSTRFSRLDLTGEFFCQSMEVAIGSAIKDATASDHGIAPTVRSLR